MTEGAEAGQEVRHTCDVPADATTAFWAFVNLDLVKPREHNLLAVPIEETVVEPRVGGSIYDRGVDGSTCHWGRVSAFDPPGRLVLAWLIGADWQVVDDPGRASEVEVRFDELAPGRTRVTLTHRHLERHGEGWAAVRDGVDGPAGWPLYLARFVEVAATAAVR